MPKKDFNIVELANNDACFDLQFRKDTKNERTGSPTYYRWKIQFVITAPKESVKVLHKIKKEIGCGNIHVVKSQARFSVQKIDDIYDTVVPYFTRHSLGGGGLIQNKKKDFQLWQKAVQIIYRNKGIYISKWKKNDLHSLIEIHKLASKYKSNPKEPKWISMAKSFAKTLQVPRPT